MPRTTPSDEERALYLLSGVVQFRRKRYIQIEGGGRCSTCAFRISDCTAFNEFIALLREEEDVCLLGVAWKELR